MKYNKKILEKINDNFKRYLGLTIENDWNLDIDEHLLNNVNFSKYDIFNNHIEYNRLVNQLELHKKYGTEVNIGILCSLYNSNPKLFYNNPKNIQKFINKKELSRNVPIDIVNFFNKRFGTKVLEYHTENVFKYIDKSLQNNESPILCRDSYLKESKHAVNILGKDSEYISYFENGKDVYINSLIDVYHELFIKKFTNFNTEFFDKYNCKEIKIFLDNNFIKLSLNDESILKEYKTLIQNFLGYSKNNKISKVFTKHLIVSSRKLSVINFGDINVYFKNIDQYGEQVIEKPINYEKDFTELIKKLDSLCFHE